MIKNIRAAFKDNVKNLDWMDDKTKKAVEEKVEMSFLFIHLPTEMKYTA